MRELITEKELLAKLSEACKAAGSQTAWARTMGLGYKWVNDVIRGQRSISAGISVPLGYRRVILFEKIEKNGKES